MATVAVVIALLAALIMMRQNISISGSPSEKAKKDGKDLRWTPPPVNHRFSATSCSIRRLTAVEAQKVGAERLINTSEPVIIPLESFWTKAAQNWSLKRLFDRAWSLNGGGTVKVGNRSNIVKKQGAADAVSMSLLEYLTQLSALQENEQNINTGFSENLVLFDQTSFCTHHHALCRSHGIPKDWQSLIGSQRPGGQLEIRTFVSIGDYCRSIYDAMILPTLYDPEMIVAC